MDCIAYGVTKSWTRLSEFHILYVGFPGGTVVKNPPANAGDTREAGSIPGSGRSLEEGTATHSSILAWRIPWTEEPGGYGPWDRKESDMTEQLN